MKTEIKTGGPAFPFAFMDEAHVSDGMTLRDYFAAKALPFILHDWKSQVEINGTDIFMMESCALSIAEDAYIMADAMLETRNN